LDGDIHYNKSYMITGPEALSYYQTAEILSNATGKKIEYMNISDKEAREGMKEAGLDDWLINTISDLYTVFRKGYASEVSSAVEEVTGKKATTFVEFSKDYADAFK
jgi:uncharacterized protein YbjT (DUF2867 family)